MFIRQKLLKYAYMDSVTHILFSLLCVKYIFFWCYGSFWFCRNGKRDNGVTSLETGRDRLCEHEASRSERKNGDCISYECDVNKRIES